MNAKFNEGVKIKARTFQERVAYEITMLSLRLSIRLPVCPSVSSHLIPTSVQKW
jgi:hypothetical protein